MHHRNYENLYYCNYENLYSKICKLHRFHCLLTLLFLLFHSSLNDGRYFPSATVLVYFLF
jgi:hypothetical protein